MGGQGKSSRQGVRCEGGSGRESNYLYWFGIDIYYRLFLPCIVCITLIAFVALRLDCSFVAECLVFFFLFIDRILILYIFVLVISIYISKAMADHFNSESED
jgi:hypothetical protein